MYKSPTVHIMTRSKAGRMQTINIDVQLKKKMKIAQQKWMAHNLQIKLKNLLISNYSNELVQKIVLNESF